MPSVERDKACAVPLEPNELHQRIKELEELMRRHAVDEGYEWPGSEEHVPAQPDDRD